MSEVNGYHVPARLSQRFVIMFCEIDVFDPGDLAIATVMDRLQAP